MSAALREKEIAGSLLSRWDARWKLCSILLAMVIVLTLRSSVVLGCGMAFVATLLAIGRITVTTVLQRLGWLCLNLAPFLLVMCLFVEQGWQVALLILLRTILIAGLILVLVLTSSASSLSAAAQQLGVPSILIQIFVLAARYARVFISELQRVRMALFCRGFRMQTTGHTFRTLGYTAGTMMIRGADRSERVADAMRTRGFRGAYQSLNELKTTSRDVVGFAVVVAVMFLLLVWDRVA